MDTMKILSRWAGMAVGAMIFTHSLVGIAATVTVFVGNTNLSGFAADVFVPPSTNINVNDKVVWVWEGLNHSSTSGTNGVPSGLWDSTINNRPHAFTNTFTAPGNFSYYCQVHVSFGMTGLISVAAVDLPPTVSITNPVNNATFSAPASFTVAATASDPDGTVTNVQFFQGATALGNFATSPYSVPVNNLAAADYTFSAVATDNGGLTATNAITIHVVTAAPIVLSAPQFLSPTDFQFKYTANSGLSYIIQRASDLGSGLWTTLSTNLATVSPMLFDDTAVSGSPAFYRVGLLPNP
jgi:plastocyanin